MKQNKIQYIWALLRFGMGWIFLWAFLDKLFGLGFATAADKAWLVGGSPTFGFLKFGTSGPLSSFYQGMAGNVIIDWLFMLGLLFIGLALILGIFVRIASLIGALLMFLMWTAFLPPKHNPFLDDHIIYLIILIGLTIRRPDQRICLGKWWANTKLVKKYQFLG
ncbi:MAG TPA: DoxX family membrane protein [Candidatus Wolfebacteria bacterium]|nr:DoxX family membrane protein [Candidatus Wolfebacteria bacterium]